MKASPFEEAYRLRLFGIEQNMTKKLMHILQIHQTLQEKSHVVFIASKDTNFETAVWLQNYYTMLSRKIPLLLLSLAMESVISAIKKRFPEQTRAYAKVYLLPYCQKPRFYRLARWIRHIALFDKGVKSLPMKKKKSPYALPKNKTLEAFLRERHINITECVTKTYVYLTDLMSLITRNHYYQQDRWEHHAVMEQINFELA